MGSEKRSKSLWLIVAFGLFIQAGIAFSEIVNVADFGDGTCSLPNANAAYNAASPGDTLVFSAGTFVWSQALNVTKPLTILGAGAQPGGTKLLASGSMDQGFFHLNNIESSKLVRISGFDFDMVDDTPKYAIQISRVSLDNLRIDHNVFTHGRVAQIVVEGSKGVIDNNDFFNGRKAISFSAGSIDQAYASWESMAAGTSNALFIEDNHFVFDSNYIGTAYVENIGTYNGGKLVIRHNHFDSTESPLAVSAYPIMTHGSDFGYWQADMASTPRRVRRGQSVVEVYNNLFEGRRIDKVFNARGSANLIHNNTIRHDYGGVSKFTFSEEEYRNSPEYDPLRQAWPAEDQVHNTFVWNNTFNGQPQSTANIKVTPDDPAPNEKIKEGRDYWLHEPQASGGREIFTGMNGAAGSYPTDGNTLPTFGTMVFDPNEPNAYYGYTPYTYPHPLQDDGPPDAPLLSVAPDVHSFGTVAVGDVADASFVVSNQGTKALDGTASVATPFSIVGEASYSVAPDEAKTITVRYTPQHTGHDSSSVLFSGGGGTSVTISGYGQEPFTNLTFDAADGLITSPFTVGPENAVSQSVLTTNPLEGGRAAYPFTLEDAGGYVVSVMVNAPDAGSNSLFVNIDSEPTGSQMIWGIPTYDGFRNQFVTWTDTPAGMAKTWSLSAGNHELIVRGREADVEILGISIQPQSTQDPNPPDPKTEPFDATEGAPIIQINPATQ